MAIDRQRRRREQVPDDERSVNRRVAPIRVSGIELEFRPCELHNTAGHQETVPECRPRVGMGDDRLDGPARPHDFKLSGSRLRVVLQSRAAAQ